MATRAAPYSTCARATRRRTASAKSWKPLASRLRSYTAALSLVMCCSHWSPGSPSPNPTVTCSIRYSPPGLNYETKGWARTKFATMAEAQNCLAAARLPACEISWANFGTQRPAGLPYCSPRSLTISVKHICPVCRNSVSCSLAAFQCVEL